MKESTKDKGRRIFAAMLAGRKITPFEANEIGKTTEGTRFIRHFRERYPVKDEKVAGERYHKYWFDEDFIKAWKEGSIKVMFGGVEVDTSLAV